MKTLIAATAALAATVTVTALLAAPAQASPPSPGAPGAGDPYFPTEGNGGYDVRHYDLWLDYRPTTDRLTAVATITATATQHLSMFDLDLHGLTVRSITVDGRPAGWSRTGDELVVHPRRALPRHHRFVTRVAYAGVPTPFDDPQLGLNGWIATDDGADVAGEPMGAATWFPVDDHPTDKASYTFTTTVPRGTEVVANGRLVSHRSHGTRTTWRYDAPDPMASYLATVDIGQFRITQRTVGGVRYLDALDPDLLEGDGVGPLVEASFAKEPELVRLESTWFGPYPWHDMGGIVDDLQIGFALETQTRPIHSPLFWIDGGQEYGDVVVVHELAHQWFGDSVAVGRWRDVWLNEGFATYAEWLYEEHMGWTTPEAQFQDGLTGIPVDDPFWDLAIGDPGPSSLFAEPVYTRGAMTLQALRDQIGDTAFFTVLRGWARTHAGRNGTTPQFIAYAERVSGQQLDALFARWLGAGYPGTAAQARTARQATVAPKTAREAARDALRR